MGDGEEGRCLTKWTGLVGSAEQARQHRLQLKPWTEQAIAGCDTLILDEVSMCSGDYLALAAPLLRRHLKVDPVALSFCRQNVLDAAEVTT